MVDTKNDELTGPDLEAGVSVEGLTESSRCSATSRGKVSS